MLVTKIADPVVVLPHLLALELEGDPEVRRLERRSCRRGRDHVDQGTDLNSHLLRAAEVLTLRVCLQTVIGGFLFLRFVCPAITTPHLYGLIDEPAPPETRRILVLVTKLLFKTATSVQFNDREAQFK